MTLSPSLVVALVVLGAAVSFGAAWFYLRRMVDPSRREVTGLKLLAAGMMMVAAGMFIRIHSLQNDVSECSASVLQAFEDGLNTRR